MAQIYFGVLHGCLVELVGHTIRHKTGAGRQDIGVTCDAHVENIIKAVLPGSGWTYHHDEVSKQVHKIAK